MPLARVVRSQVAGDPSPSGRSGVAATLADSSRWKQIGRTLRGSERTGGGGERSQRKTDRAGKPDLAHKRPSWLEARLIKAASASAL